MNSIKPVLLFLAFLSTNLYGNENTPNNNIKLYAIDCGAIGVSDMKDLSNNGAYDGQSMQLANPCFLIRHPKGDLLWETGLEDSLADNPDGEQAGVWHYSLKSKLTSQLKQISVSPTDIEYLSLSHIHPDHAGNANKYAASTFIVNNKEQEYMFSSPINDYFGKYYSSLKNANTVTFDDNYDVFNDGSVVIKAMPGHTPGSSVLLLKLANAGNILLTGDLYIHQGGRQQGTMHKYNTDKQLTVESRKHFEALAKKEKAKVIIQHEKSHFEQLPKFPKFLD